MAPGPNGCMTSTNGRCGPSFNNTYCTPGAYCSQFEWCGVGPAWQNGGPHHKYDGNNCKHLPATRTVFITNKNSGKVMDVAGAKFEAGTDVIQYQKHGGKNQRFVMEYNGEKSFKIHPLNNQKITAGLDGQNMRMVNRSDWKHSYQLVPEGDYFRIKSDHKCLDVDHESKNNSARILFWDCKQSNFDNQ